MKLGAGLVAIAAIWLGLTLFGNARFHAGELTEAGKWQAKVIDAERGKLAAYQAGLARAGKAETIYRETERVLQPITTKLIERTREYAATAAGAAVCLPADRVLWLDQARSALFPAPAAAAADRGDGTVHPDVAADQP